MPARSVQTGPNGQFVFVVKPDQTAEVRTVKVARTRATTRSSQGLAAANKSSRSAQLRLAPGIKVESVARAPQRHHEPLPSFSSAARS